MNAAAQLKDTIEKFAEKHPFEFNIANCGDLIVERDHYNSCLIPQLDYVEELLTKFDLPQYVNFMKTFFVVRNQIADAHTRIQLGNLVSTINELILAINDSSLVNYIPPERDYKGPDKIDLLKEICEKLHYICGLLHDILGTYSDFFHDFDLNTMRGIFTSIYSPLSFINRMWEKFIKIYEEFHETDRGYTNEFENLISDSIKSISTFTPALKTLHGFLNTFLRQVGCAILLYENMDLIFNLYKEMKAEFQK